MSKFYDRGFRQAVLTLQARLDQLSADVIDFENSVAIHKKFLDAEIVVTLKHEAAPVGDTLNTLPWIVAISHLHGRVVHARGQFNDAVKNLVCDMPIKFDTPSGPGPIIEYVADVKASWDFSGPRGFHMIQGYFALAGMSVPNLPISLPLISESCGLPSGVVISPFSGAEHQNPIEHVRVWYTDRWNAVIEFLLSTGKTSCIYLLGGKQDDPTPFLRDGVVPVIGFPLTQVLDLMRRSQLCISIDTGTSHLAHLGGIERHILLYPEVNFPTIHPNPRARVLRAWPKDISVDAVITEVATMVAQVS